MSEYQRYEFMTVDRPLTRAQLNAVNDLSSHIEASSTHAVVEYNWGDFKHDPIKVLHKYFDGFLYWANWGSPRLAFRFPHGVLPADLIAHYDFNDWVTFTRYSDYDILDISFGGLEAPDMWTEYDLGSLIAIRNELMEGDMRALYIAWLAAQSTLRSHTGYRRRAAKDDFASWVEALPQKRRSDYLVRLARNEPGLSRLLVKELRELNPDKTKVPPTGEQVTYAILLAESKVLKARLEHERREQERLERERHLQAIHEHKDDYWQQVELGALRKNAWGYDEAVKLLVDLRDAANQFNEAQEFQTRFRTWVQSHLRRPALLERLRQHKFPLPQT